MSLCVHVCIGSIENANIVGEFMLEIDHYDYLALHRLPGLRVARNWEIGDNVTWFEPRDLLHDLLIMIKHLEATISNDGKFSHLAMDVKPEIELIIQECARATELDTKIGLCAI